MAKGDLTIVLNKAEYERLVKTLDSAGDIDTSPAVQRGLREGANIMKSAGQANLAARNKVQTGDLKKSFTIKVTRRKKVGRNYALTGFKRPKGAHAHLIDRGTKKRWTSKGYYRGSVSRGRPNTGSLFFTDAVQTEGPRALNNLVSVIQSELKRMMG